MLIGGRGGGGTVAIRVVVLLIAGATCGGTVGGFPALPAGFPIAGSEGIGIVVTCGPGAGRCDRNASGDAGSVIVRGTCVTGSIGCV